MPERASASVAIGSANFSLPVYLFIDPNHVRQDSRSHPRGEWPGGGGGGLKREAHTLSTWEPCDGSCMRYRINCACKEHYGRGGTSEKQVRCR